ncbi:hypothetical protein [Roseivivax marinus]|uniref:hypothetical protein n=1 Tax=Roseivivax marinus TaxID=1379903 RepID=UPI00273E5AD7|nr:hypothetical protein [Roseivivax marinus]
MNNISVLSLEPANLSPVAVAAVSSFFEREAHGLCEILEALGESDALDAALEIAMTGAQQTDTLSLIEALNLVLEALEGVPFLAVLHAEMAGFGPRDLQGGIRWHGARLAELVDGLRLVECIGVRS